MARRKKRRKRPRIKRFWIAVDEDTEKRFHFMCEYFGVTRQMVLGRLMTVWVRSMEKKEKALEN